MVLVGLYVCIYVTTPGGLTGGDRVGLVYGIAGSLLMAFAGALTLLRRVPTWWWIGSRRAWLRGHLWLGLLSGVLILCHSGGRFGGPLEQILMVVVLLVLGTGAVGLGLQFVLPRMMTVRITAEGPYHQIPRLCEAMRQECDQQVEKACAPPAKPDPAALTADQQAFLRQFYRDVVRPFLAATFNPRSSLAHPLSAERQFDQLHRLTGRQEGEPSLPVLALLRTCCDERRQLGEQERLHFWLHSWLLLHVPLSVVLLVLGVVHAVMAVWY